MEVPVWASFIFHFALGWLAVDGVKYHLARRRGRKLHDKWMREFEASVNEGPTPELRKAYEFYRANYKGD